MTTSQIIEIQRHIGTVPDGYWGPKSIHACQLHLCSLMPSPHPWPASDQKSLRKFFGSPGDESNLTNLPVSGLGIRYGGAPVPTVHCHSRVAESLGRVLAAIAASPHAGILAHYDGCYCNRAMRNGSLPSLHAWGSAVDFDSDHNGNLEHWPASAQMPLDVMEMFASEGWMSLGAFIGRDAMHFQATR